jgi:hypothetical protein
MSPSMAPCSHATPPRARGWQRNGNRSLTMSLSARRHRGAIDVAPGLRNRPPQQGKAACARKRQRVQARLTLHLTDLDQRPCCNCEASRQRCVVSASFQATF